MTSKHLTYGALAALILIWGTTWAAIRIGLQGIPPFTGVALRFALAATVLLVASRMLGLPLGSSSRERSLWLIIALLSFSTSYGVVYWAEQWVPSGLAAVLFSTYPLFVAAMAHFWLPGERLTPVGLFGITLGFVGVVTIFSEDLTAISGMEVRRASVLFLISPMVSALANVLVKRWGTGVHPMSLTAVPMAMTGIFMGGLAAAVERERVLTFDAVSIGALVYLAVLGTAVTFFLHFWLLSRLPASRLSLITYGIPVVAVLVGTLLLDEPFTLRMLMGSIVVLFGVTLAIRFGANR